MTQWEVLLDPVDGNSSGTSGVNEGGLIVYITDGEKRKELTRIAFNRKNSSQPKKSLDKAISEEVKAAQLVADRINDRINQVHTKLMSVNPQVDVNGLLVALRSRSLNLRAAKDACEDIINKIDAVHGSVEDAELELKKLHDDTPGYDETLR
jgi:predicted  nucleic acid-binding Zn-ribbon protein